MRVKSGARFVWHRYIGLAVTTFAASFTGVVHADSAEAKLRINVREGQGTNFPIATTLSPGQKVEVLEWDGEYVRVRTAGGPEGFLKHKFLTNVEKTADLTPPAPAMATPVQEVVVPPATDLQKVEAESPDLAIENSADAAKLDMIVVTGSRVRSAVSDAPRPVSTMAIEDMQLSGIDSVADALRDSSYNTLGSYTQQSGSSFGGVALIDLKGLGEDRTAVLINGRRVPGNPWTGTSAVDINTIPMSAVDRIEILTDSASAVYGADAIGGVVNIILKKQWDGLELQVGGARPTRDNANTDSVSFTFGSRGKRGGVIFSGEWYKKLPVFDADRDYSNVQINGGSGAGGLPVDGTTDVQGINGGGNSLFSLDFSEALGYPGTCDYAGLTPVADPFGVPGTGCGFGYADYSMQTAGLERRAVVATADYEINKYLEAFVESRVVSNKSIGRFAPAIGGFFFSSASSQNTLGEDAILYHRFVGHGTRDDSGESHEIDTTLGLRGSLFETGINFEAYYRDYRMNAADKGQNYILSSVIEDLVANDEYNVADPFAESNASAIALSRATLSRDITTVWEGWGITLDGALEGFELPGGAVGWAAGIEGAREAYADIYDSYREAGNVIGSAGNSSSGSRSRRAAFAEIQLPILDNLQTNIAARFDDYNDFGNEFSPQISARYRATDWLTARVSWGEGFKAPNLTDMYSLAAQDFQGVADVVRCRAQGIADEDCPRAQIETFTGGNPELKAETSESWNLGLILNPIDGLQFSVDYWNIELDDAVSQVAESDLLEMEALGSLPPGVYINRGPTVDGIPGPITRCEGSDVPFPNCGFVNVKANLAALDVSGIDYRVRYDMDAGLGKLTAMANWSNLVKYDETLPVIGLTKHAGTTEYPEDRANLTLRYALSDYTLSYLYNWVGSHGDDTYQFDSWTTHDLNFVWNSPWSSVVSLGVRNLTDEDPVIETNSGWDSTTSRYALELYSVAGRVYTASIRHRF